jgi:hypothetical protein
MSLSPSSKNDPCLVCGFGDGDCFQGENRHYWQCGNLFRVDEEWEEYEIINGFRFLGNTVDDLRGRFCLDHTGECITPYHDATTCHICLTETGGAS